MILNSVLPALWLLPSILCAPLLVDHGGQAPLQQEGQNDEPESSYRIPSRYESTVLARRLLALSTLGAVSTVFPPPDVADQHQHQHANTSPDTDMGTSSPLRSTLPKLETWSPNPSSVSSLPIALPEYLADCEHPSTGNPTLLLLDPSTVSRNLRALPAGHQNLSLSLSWWEHLQSTASPGTDQQPLHEPLLHDVDLDHGDDNNNNNNSPPPYYHDSPFSLPRLSLLGYTEEIPTSAAEDSGLVSCFLRAHPDARWWLPDDRHAAHAGRWVRMVVTHVYWLGGFGDRAYLSWLDVREWAAVEEVEWKRVRLPGE